MKKLTQLGLALLLGLTTSLVTANENATETNKAITPETQTTVTQTKAKAVAVNPNLVNINTASAAEIQDKLVGIGAKKAQAIIEYREKHGKFMSVEQLTEVSGIGKATLEKNRDRIVLE